MTILILFAFLAGVATIFAPCILPVLPVVLSAGISGGKRRPLGIVVGLVASFTFFTLSISWLTRHLGINPEGLRLFAIVVLLLFGAMLLIPKLLIAFEAMLSKLIPQVSIESPRTDFFWRGTHRDEPWIGLDPLCRAYRGLCHHPCSFKYYYAYISPHYGSLRLRNRGAPTDSHVRWPELT